MVANAMHNTGTSQRENGRRGRRRICAWRQRGIVTEFQRLGKCALLPMR